MHTIQMHLCKKQKIFSEFFSAFFESPLNFQHFQKKRTFIAYVFAKLPTTRNLLREMSKSSRFREPVDRQHGKWAEALILYYQIAFIILSDHCEGNGVAKVTLKDVKLL